MSRSGTDIDPRILGQLLAAQSTISAFSERQRMGEFVCRAVEEIPGVGSCAVCMPSAERPLLGGEPIPECADCDVPEGDIDHDPSLPCRLPSCTGLQVFPLRTQDRHFGFCLLKVNKPEQYAPYKPFVGNLIDSLAVNVERKKQEKLITSLNEQQQIILDAVPAMIFYKDKENRFIRVNEALAKANGLSKKEMEGKTMWELYPREAADHFWQDDKEVMAAGKPILNIIEEMKTSQDVRWVQTDKIPYRNSKGEIIGIIGFTLDITERKQAEEELRETKDYLESLIGYANAPIIVWDPQFHITRFNHAFESLTGRKTGEVIGKPLSILFPADQVERSMEIIRQTLSGERWEDVEIRILLSDGTDRIVLWNSATIYGADGKTPVATIAQGHDITERKRAEQNLIQAKADLEQANKQLQDAFELESKLTAQAQAANTAKSRFLANMSHEIRTPMNGVIGICELLLDTKMTNEQLKYAQTINSSAQALLNIISATLDFSKIEAGKIELEQIDFNLSNIVEHIISVLGVNAAQKKLELVGSIEPNVPLNLNGDPGRLQQVLSNLIANAIKFTSKGKIAITVALAEEKEDKAVLRFSVRDTGIGIPADKTNLLFSAFTQADASMTRKFGGTGLGLVISKGLVEQMGGSIGVESVPGQGSTFWFIIPFLKQQADGGPSQPTEPAAVTGKVLEVKPLRILVAEDSMTNQMVVLGMLKKMGHIANAVADGKEAVKALETIPYDLVLMDIQMPEMNGLEATAIIRDPKSRVRDHNIPILAFTAHTMPEDRKQCMSAGMNGYITKPVSIKSVADAIANIATPDNASAHPDSGNPTPSDEPAVVFDSRALSDQLSGDNAIIREVINIFLKETPKIMYELEQAIKKQQGNDAARLIHAIKGSAANIRGNQFGAITVKVEAACKAENWPAAEALIPQLKKQFKSLDLAMHKFLKTLNEG